MSYANKLSLKVMLNKDKTKVLFAESNNHFVDILLSFLTLPLGRIVKVLDNGEEAAIFGSLSTLYHSLANLESSHFVTEGAKKTLLESMSSFQDEYEKLKLDFTDSPPAKYFFCSCCPNRFRSVSAYYDKASNCYYCKGTMTREAVQKRCGASSCDGVFTIPEASFIISDDLLILPKETGFFQIISILGITDMDKAEQIEVHFWDE